MPTSTSPRRSAERGPAGASNSSRPGAAPRQSLRRWALLLAILVVLVVLIAVLPASLAMRALPKEIEAADFSGTLWHGSAGSVRLQGRSLGALEWRLHPLALLSATLGADLHWVLRGVVLDGRLEASRRELHLSQLEGGGPLEDLAALGVPGDVRGTAQLHLQRLDARLDGALPMLIAAVGTLRIDDLMFDGATTPLGAYVLEVPAPAGTSAAIGAQAAAGEIVGRVHDTGGALGLDAQVRFAPSTRLGTISGTVQPRAPIPPALQQGIDDLSRLHRPDAQGRIPLDLELHL